MYIYILVSTGLFAPNNMERQFFEQEMGTPCKHMNRN